MQIVVLSRQMFEKFMQEKKITPENVESLKDVFIISIQNDTGDDNYTPTFTKSLENVHVVKFSDVDEDTRVPVFNNNINANPGDGGLTHYVTAKAMTAEQAKELYQFIMNNKARDKKVCLIHCTAGVARSGAVGTFVAECMGVDYIDFKRANPSIQPNIHVLKMLREARFPGTHDADWTDFWLEANQYFSIVRKGDLPVLREAYPDMTELLANAKMYVNEHQLNDLPTFGTKSEYTGITLGRWLAENNMLQYFN